MVYVCVASIMSMSVSICGNGVVVRMTYLLRYHHHCMFIYLMVSG